MELQFIEKLKIQEGLKPFQAKELIDSAITVGFILEDIIEIYRNYGLNLLKIKIEQRRLSKWNTNVN